MFGFRWSKKAKITLETVCFWQNISVSISKFSPFLYRMKSYQFPKNALIRKENQSYSSQWEKKKWTLFITGCFIKPFKIINFILFITQAHSQRNYRFLLSGWRKKYKKEKLGMANCNIYFKNNFNRWIMNITHKLSLLTKCAYMTLNEK